MLPAYTHLTAHLTAVLHVETYGLAKTSHFEAESGLRLFCTHRATEVPPVRSAVTHFLKLANGFAGKVHTLETLYIGVDGGVEVIIGGKVGHWGGEVFDLIGEGRGEQDQGANE